jgi:hypothetical protein
MVELTKIGFKGKNLGTCASGMYLRCFQGPWLSPGGDVVDDRRPAAAVLWLDHRVDCGIQLKKGCHHRQRFPWPFPVMDWLLVWALRNY